MDALRGCKALLAYEQEIVYPNGDATQVRVDAPCRDEVAALRHLPPAERWRCAPSISSPLRQAVS